jgi:hypothetical protein
MKNAINNTIGILLLLFVVSLFGCQEDEITNISAGTLTIDKTEVTLDPGETAQLTATVMPDNAGNRAVFWKSNNVKVATVDNGVVVALSPGTTTISAIAYSNADAYAEVTVTVTGVPEDLAAAVAGTYVGTVAIPMMGSLPDIELALTPDDNQLKLTTTVEVPGFGTLEMDIPMTVTQNGNDYDISGTGITALFGPVTLTGTVTAAGAIDLTIHVDANDMDVTYTGQKLEDLAAAVAGTYVGTVAIPQMGDLSNIELALTPNSGQVTLTTALDIPTQGTLDMDIPMTVTQNGDDYDIFGTGITALFGPVTLTGTVTAAGVINLIIHVDAMGMDVTYTGQKLEDPAKAVAGTYMGTVSIPMLGNLPDIELALTPDGNQVKLTTTVEVPGFGTLDMDIPMTVTRNGNDYDISGTGTTALFGSVTLTGTVTAAGVINLTIHVDAMGMDVTYEGQKQ